MAVLQALQGKTPGQIIPLERASMLLGRHPDCDLVLESAAVSRHHARVFEIEGNYYLEDLNSRNGTFLNGQPVFQRQTLREHDQIAICDLLFVFHTGVPDLNLPLPSPRRQVEAETTAMMVEDEAEADSSKVMTKLEVPTGSSGLRLELNPAAKLRALLEISQSLGRALRLGEVLPKLLDNLFTIFLQADRGFILLRDASGKLALMAAKHRREAQAEKIRISRTIVNGVMASKEAVLSADASADSRFDMAQSIVDFQIRSVMCAPLVTSEGNALGVIQLDTLDQRNRFSREDLDLLASVACQAGIAVENAQLHEAAMRDEAMKRELSVAHDLLRGILPTASPDIPQYEFFEFYEPVNLLGGDYYDYIPLSGGRLGVAVADVSGKGIPAALLMARLSADTRYCLASEPTPAQAVARLNRVFYDSGWEDRFVTLVLAVLDPARDEVTIVNAGHMPPLLRSGPQAVVPAAEADAGLPLGVDRDVVYAQRTLPLAPGHSLTLFTDGITEAMNARDELYGSERLCGQLASQAGRVGVLGRRVLDDVKQFVGIRPQSDDMCLVCFGRKEEGGRS